MRWRSAGLTVYKGELQVERLLPAVGLSLPNPPSARRQTRASLYTERNDQRFPEGSSRTASSGVSFAIVMLGFCAEIQQPESWLFSFLAFVFGDFREKPPRAFSSRLAGEGPFSCLRTARRSSCLSEV